MALSDPDAHAEPESELAGGPLEIDDPELLKVVYDPLRFRLLLLAAQPRTVTELAEAVGLPRGRLYYHVHRLEEHGLLEVAGEETAGTRVERSYRSRFSSFTLSPSLRGHPLARSHAPLLKAVQDLVDGHLIAFASGMRAPTGENGPSAVLSRQRRLPRERAEEYLHRLDELTEQYFGEESSAPADDGGSWYASLVLLTPIARPFRESHAVYVRLDQDED